jgi:hypothetical protein
MIRGRAESRLADMTSTAASTVLLYVECDIPDGQTLTAWRTERERERRAARARRGPLARLRRSR